MKVYVITSGEYSDYHIDAVFTSKDEAEAMCAFLNDALNTCHEVEEYEADAVKVEGAKEIKTKFEMCVCADNADIQDFKRKFLTYNDYENIRYSAYDKKKIYISVALPKDTTDEQAKKIMLDRIAKYKTERAGMV